MRFVPAVVLLAAASVAWAAAPMDGTGVQGELLVVVAAICILGGLVRHVRLVRQRFDMVEKQVFRSSPLESVERTIQLVPWETGAAVAVVVLEALHHRPPWHSGVLALVLIAYLLVVREAEAATHGPLFRGQVATGAACVVLVVLVTAVAALPSAGTGTLAGWLEAAGALGAVVAIGLVMPRTT